MHSLITGLFFSPRVAEIAQLTFRIVTFHRPPKRTKIRNVVSLAENRPDGKECLLSLPR